MCNDAKSLASCCVLYSIVGGLFMLMVVLMLTYQPLFIGGIDNLGRAKANAYGALFTFVVAFGVSILYLLQDRITGRSATRHHPHHHHHHHNSRRRRGDDYEGVPTNSNGSHSDYPNSLDLQLPRSIQEGMFS